MINDEGEVKAMTKFEATKIIHALLDSEVSMAEYEEKEITKIREAGASTNDVPPQYRIDALATRKKNVEALQLAGMALTGEV